MKNRWVTNLVIILMFISVCIMSALFANNYHKIKNSNINYVNASLFITYNNDKQIKLDRENIDYDYEFNVTNNSLYTVKYKLILVMNNDDNNITYNLEGNPFKKTKEDILINKNGKINKNKIEFPEAVITGNQTHYYKLNIKCSKCKTKIIGMIELESD